MQEELMNRQDMLSELEGHELLPGGDTAAAQGEEAARIGRTITMTLLQYPPLQ